MSDLTGRWYTAKDVKGLLGITSSQLFHWRQTWNLIEPEIKGGGRAFKDKYSFINLLDLSLIKELNELGLEPSKIKDVLKPYDRPDAPKEWRGSIWNFFKNGREDKEDFFEESGKWETIPGYDKAGCIIIMGKEGDEFFIYEIGRSGNVSSFLQGMMRRTEKAPKTFILIDLLKIVKEVEEEMGAKL